MLPFLLGTIMAKTISTVSSTSGPFTYANYVIDSFVEGKPIKAAVNKTEKALTINRNNKQNSDLIASLKSSYDRNKRDEILSLLKNKNSILVSTDKVEFKLGDILKPAKETPELGYIGEAIIQAGIFARFCNKDRNISRADIEKRLNDFLKSASNKTKTAMVDKSPNYQQKGSPKVPDDIVECSYELAEKYVSWLMKAEGKYQKHPYTALDPLFRDAVLFANSPTVTSQSKEIFYNGRQDRISIEGTGVSGQNITKADIKVYKYLGFVDKKSAGTKTEINLRISAKIKDITQFGQVSGLTWDKQTILFDQLFGVSIDGIKNKYDSLVKEPSMLIDNSQVRLNAYALTYQEAAKQFNQSSNRIKRIVEGVKHFMTLNEEETGGVRLFVVSIGGAGLSVTDTGRLNEQSIKKYMADNKYTEKDIQAHYRETGAGRELYIKIGKETLVDLKGRWTANRCANYVSGGPLLYKLLKD
jgi:hypothetical protein